MHLRVRCSQAPCPGRTPCATWRRRRCNGASERKHASCFRRAHRCAGARARWHTATTRAESPPPPVSGPSFRCPANPPGHELRPPTQTDHLSLHLHPPACSVPRPPPPSLARLELAADPVDEEGEADENGARRRREVRNMDEEAGPPRDQRWKHRPDALSERAPGDPSMREGCAPNPHLDPSKLGSTGRFAPWRTSLRDALHRHAPGPRFGRACERLLVIW